MVLSFIMLLFLMMMLIIMIEELIMFNYLTTLGKNIVGHQVIL